MTPSWVLFVTLISLDLDSQLSKHPSNYFKKFVRFDIMIIIWIIINSFFKDFCPKNTVEKMCYLSDKCKLVLEMCHIEAKIEGMTLIFMPQ